jgi:hypothetical protein
MPSTALLVAVPTWYPPLRKEDTDGCACESGLAAGLDDFSRARIEVQLKVLGLPGVIPTLCPLDIRPRGGAVQPP